jgi:hypothetical protein
MRLTALMAVYNEADILQAMLRHYTRRGMWVYVLDNWSKDGSYEIAESEPGVVVQRWPEQPIETFEWGAMLDFFQAKLPEIPADWFSLCGADHYLDTLDGREFMEVLVEADRLGYNALSFVHRAFDPPDDSFTVGDPVATFNGHYTDDPGWLCDTWKKLPGVTPDLRNAGGHDVTFPGRRVYPYKLLRRHYPIRSQAHGERKVFKERLPRWSAAERAIGWHVQYDGVEPGYRFVEG